MGSGSACGRRTGWRATASAAGWWTCAGSRRCLPTTSCARQRRPAGCSSPMRPGAPRACRRPCSRPWPTAASAARSRGDQPGQLRPARRRGRDRAAVPGRHRGRRAHPDALTRAGCHPPMLLRMRSGQQWISLAVTAGARAAAPPPAGDSDLIPELADVARLLRRLVRQAVSAARAEEGSVRHLLTSYLGPQVAASPVANGFWPRYDQVNVQAGLDAWLADLAAPGPAQRHSGIGSVTTVALPSGPDGATRPCVQCALYLVTDPDGRLVILVRPAEEQ